MKLLFLWLLYPAIIIAPKRETIDLYAEFGLKKRNILVNIIINKLIAYVRHVIIHGSAIIGIPPLDPFRMDDFHVIIPTGQFNFQFQLKNLSLIGFGGFVMHRNDLYLSNLTFEIEVSVPRIIISADALNLRQLNNNFNYSLPTYNKDKTEFELDHFRLQANLQLKQSEDEKSILIEKIDHVDLDIPTFKVNLDGVIDENNLYTLSKIEELLAEYINDCKEVITKVISNAIITFGNPILNQLDTWRYIDVL